MGHICNQIQCWSCFELLGANISRILGPSKVQAKQHHNIRPHVGQRKVYLSQSPTTTVKWKRNEQRWTKYIKQVNCRLITLRFYMFHALNWNNPNVSQCLFQFRSNLCSFFMGHLWLTPWSETMETDLLRWIYWGLPDGAPMEASQAWSLVLWLRTECLGRLLPCNQGVRANTKMVEIGCLKNQGVYSCVSCFALSIIYLIL